MKNIIEKSNKNVRMPVGAGLGSARDQRGITLIALILTIIVLLILAGVALNFVIGENGILRHAEFATEKYSIESAKEELRLDILNIQTEILKTEGRKATLEDLEARIDKAKYEIEMHYEPIATSTPVVTPATYVIVKRIGTNYYFTVDNILIITNVEEIEIPNPIEGTKPIPGIKETDEVNANVNITTYMAVKSNTITTLVLSNLTDVVYTIQSKTDNLTITDNVIKADLKANSKDSCVIKIEGKFKGYSYTNKLTVYIEPKSTTTTNKEGDTINAYAIYDPEDLVRFKEIVNKKVATEHKNAKLMNDIDLSGVCSKSIGSWEPIGLTSCKYTGTFDGAGHAIKNLYGSYSYSGAGLFGYVGGLIKNLTVYGQIYGNETTACMYGGIVGMLDNGTVYRCANYASVKAYTCGGVVGWMANSTIEECYNAGTIEGKIIVAGVLGRTNVGKGTVINCYNKGTIKATSDTPGGIVGYCSSVGASHGYAIKNCYNIGSSTGSSHINGAIMANDEQHKSTRSNCYWLSTGGFTAGCGRYDGTNGTTKCDASVLKGKASSLGSAYITDGKIKNISGEWVDNLDDDGKIIYINNGYPILKWQIGE